jgi:peptidoglycan/xylan/chitin deacetylase (PgdA/CDA1 family)
MPAARAPTIGTRALAALALSTLAACAFPGILVPEDDLLYALHTRGAPDAPVVALTFDDGPNGKCTDEVLDALGTLDVPATFFVLGANVDADGNDGVLARMMREGHTIGLHGYRHDGRLLVVPKVLLAQLHDTERAVGAALARAGVPEPPRLRLFRPPFGFLTAATANAVTRDGFVLVLWTISVGDWRANLTAEEIVARIMERIRPGDVVVLHDGFLTHQRSRDACTDRTVVADVVRRLVPRVRERGLRFAPLDEVLRLPKDER